MIRRRLYPAPVTLTMLFCGKPRWCCTTMSDSSPGKRNVEASVVLIFVSLGQSRTHKTPRDPSLTKIFGIYGNRATACWRAPSPIRSRPSFKSSTSWSASLAALYSNSTGSSSEPWRCCRLIFLKTNSTSISLKPPENWENYLVGIDVWAWYYQELIAIRVFQNNGCLERH